VLREVHAKTRSQNVVAENTYFKKVPLIEKRTKLSVPLIPLFSVNKGIRENGKWVALLLRVLSKNKGLTASSSARFLIPLRFIWNDCQIAQKEG